MKSLHQIIDCIAIDSAPSQRSEPSGIQLLVWPIRLLISCAIQHCFWQPFRYAHGHRIATLQPVLVAIRNAPEAPLTRFPAV